MKSSLEDPRDCYDFETLWQWLEDIQELATTQRELVSCCNRQAM
ncbi:hypothetical protein [Spirosoma arboris]|nr:hypothetical protein [Spirosoma arboris]